ncbi:MAG: translation elongation factor-like protein [Candidatus ainarchaeum sp.]|nr:translation elongation factor-like protein [Candidatus ainarchaeum sp.]
MEKTPIGKITHFFDKIGVAVLELSGPLKQGEKISVEGHAGELFEQTVGSMQIDKKTVVSAKKGQAIGLKLIQPVKPIAQVFKVK